MIIRMEICDETPLENKKKKKNKKAIHSEKFNPIFTYFK